MLNVLSSIGETFIIYYIVFYKADKTKKIFGFCVATVNMIILSMMNYFSISAYFKIIMYWLLSAFLFSLIYRIGIGKIIFQVLISILFISICDVIALSLFEFFSKMDVETQLESVKGVRWILTLFSKSLCFGTIVLICHHFDFDKVSTNSRDYSVIIPFFVDLVIIFLLGYTLLNTPNSSDFLFVLLTFLILVSSFFNLFLTRRHLEIKELEHKNKLSVYQIESQHKYYKLKKEELDKIQQIRHDLKNHILIMETEVQDKHKEYVEKLINEIDSYYTRYNTGNEIIDILLTEKLRIADENSINFSACLSMDDINFISNIDLVTILGNVLDNALEACITKEVGEKYVKINGKTVEKFYVLICENSNLKELRKEDGKFLTSKPNKKEHGLGIANIQRTVKKYGGVVSFVNDNSVFSVKILLPLS